MPALGGPGPRRTNTRAYRKRERNVARIPKAAPQRARVYVAPARAYKPAAAPRPRPTPAQLSAARAQERSYASQGRAIQKQATSQRVESYLTKSPATRRAQVKQIKAKAPTDRTSGERRVLDIHGRRQGVDVRQRKDYGFLPRTKITPTYEVRPTNVMPRPESTAKALEKASPKLRAAAATNPKIKAQLGGMLAAGKSSDAALATLKEQKGERAATVQAPALKLLDLPMRPGYAALEQARTDIKRGGIGEVFAVRAPGSKAAKERRQAYKRGITGKARTTGSDVLAQAGVKNPIVKAIGGLTLDLGANPLTFAQGGAGTVAGRAGQIAARKALGASVRGGARRAAIAKVRQAGEAQARKEVGVVGPLTRAQHEATREAGERAVSKVVQRARAQAEKAAPKGKGITVRFAGTEVPGVRRATAAVGRRAERVVPKAVPRIARKATRPFRPTIRAHDYPAEQFEAGLHAAAGARAQIARAERQALTLGQHLKTNLPEDTYDDVIRALERNDIKSLPEEHRDTVINLRSAFRQYFREGRRAGTIRGEVGNFDNWLKKGEARKLLRTVEAETGAQARALGAAGRRLERAGSRVTLATTEAAGRQRVGAVRATEQDRRRQALARQRELGSAGVAFERRRGGEALTGQRQLQSAERQLKTELAKPVSKRRGVAALEGRVQRLRQREPSERLVAAKERLEAARAPVAPVRQPAATAPTGARVQRATAAHGERAQELQAQQARSLAAKDIPAKRRSESDQAYLTRLRDHARQHNLPLVEQRATRLLEAKPQMTRGYFPREFQTRINRRFGVIKKGEPVGRATGQPLSGTSKKVSRITAGYRRAEQRPLHEVNKEREAKGLEPFTTNVPVSSLNYVREAGKATAEAGLARKLGDVGREYKPPAIRPGESTKDFAARRAAAAEQFSKSVGEGEQLYFVGNRNGKFDLHEAAAVKGKLKTRTSAQAQKKAEKDPGWAARQAFKPVSGESGRYVVLNKKMVDELRGVAAPQSDLLAGYDRALGRWKGAAIANPAFHIRNLIGDIHTASYDQPLLNLLGRTGPQAAKAIRRESALGRVVRPTEAGRQTKFQRALGKTPLGVPTERSTIKVAGQRRPVDDFLKDAHEDGIIDAGYVGSEVHDLINQGVEEVRGIRKAGVLRKGARASARWTRNRENITRLATYKAALDRGLSRAEARRLTSELHIDYAHLSDVERRGLRRAMPFYTWTARSIPLTAKKYVTRPGKFAAFESAREETAKAFGTDEQKARSQMGAATQRQLPFTIKIPGRKEPVALSWSDPMTLLGDLPTGKDFPAEAKRLAAGQLAPFPKWAIEMATNRNLMTGADIEGKHLATAPSSVARAIETGAIPAAVVRKMKIVPPKGSPEARRAGVPGFVDYKTGRPAWGWRGNADYVYDQSLLGLGGQVAAAIGAGRSPAQEKLQSFGSLAGARFDPLDKDAVKRAGQQRLRKEADRLNSRQDILRDVGVSAEHPTREYKTNLKRLGEINKVLYPHDKKPKKTGGFGGGAGFGGGFSGGSGFRGS